MKDFFLHLFTITIGLLIAVGIEGCVELHREHRLVSEARETLHDEIHRNADSMTGAVAALNKQVVALDNNIKTLQLILDNPKDKDAQNASIEASFSMKTLASTAWKTAQTTGALSYMPYDEAERYADIYEAQNSFLTQQEKILEDETQFIGVLRKTHFGHGDITPEQAGLALERFGIWQGHLTYLDLVAKFTLACDKAFLDGKACPKDMHEGFDK